jgi:hypothetical protein
MNVLQGQPIDYRFQCSECLIRNSERSKIVVIGHCDGDLQRKADWIDGLCQDCFTSNPQIDPDFCSICQKTITPQVFTLNSEGLVMESADLKNKSRITLFKTMTHIGLILGEGVANTAVYLPIVVFGTSMGVFVFEDGRELFLQGRLPTKLFLTLMGAVGVVCSIKLIVDTAISRTKGLQGKGERGLAIRVLVFFMLFFLHKAIMKNPDLKQLTASVKMLFLIGGLGGACGAVQLIEAAPGEFLKNIVTDRINAIIVCFFVEAARRFS